MTKATIARLISAHFSAPRLSWWNCVMESALKTRTAPPRWIFHLFFTKLTPYSAYHYYHYNYYIENRVFRDFVALVARAGRAGSGTIPLTRLVSPFTWSSSRCVNSRRLPLRCLAPTFDHERRETAASTPVRHYPLTTVASIYCVRLIYYFQLPFCLFSPRNHWIVVVFVTRICSFLRSWGALSHYPYVHVCGRARARVVDFSRPSFGQIARPRHIFHDVKRLRCACGVWRDWSRVCNHSTPGNSLQHPALESAPLQSPPIRHISFIVLLFVLLLAIPWWLMIFQSSFDILDRNEQNHKRVLHRRPFCYISLCELENEMASPLCIRCPMRGDLLFTIWIY